MGSDQFYPEERPARAVSVEGFWMDAGPVTNARFARFIRATGYVTTAERPADPERHPGIAPEMLRPSGLVFRRTATPVPLSDPRLWWRLVPGANWRRPFGATSSTIGREKHPVVQVSYEDAKAYAGWAGKQLPTEAEWEFAARGGLDGATFVWGNRELGRRGERLANTWQGNFPHSNTREDGFLKTSPVRSFPSNGYGLFDMAGNVWEWTRDKIAPPTVGPNHPCCGGESSRSCDHNATPPEGTVGTTTPLHVLKGGSYLCSPNSCFRYRPAARSFQERDFSSCHLGFRCIGRTTQVPER
jgi:formylglycine-generating enzyme